MTESKAKDHSLIEIRDDHKEKADNVGKQTSSGSKNSDKLLASSIQGKLRKEYPLPDQTCIYRVPHKLVRHNEEAFVPSLVSIGPYHHGEKKLQAMEEMKLWYLHGLVERKPNQNTSLETFVATIRSMEQFCRDCYHEKFDNLRSDRFVEMMVVDGCFIIELFRINRWLMVDGPYSDSDPDPIFKTPWMLSTIRDDLLLLENQLPWEVAACLFELTEGENESLRYLAELFLDKVFGTSMPVENMSSETRTGISSVRHFLDIARGAALGQPSRQDCYFYRPIPSVTELLEIGVDFERAPNFEKPDLLDITFENGLMRIPPLSIGENGERFVRNLIAYELCAPKHEEYYVISYAKLFSCLIKSTKDAEFLMAKGIIQTQLSKEDIACFFTRICKDIETEGDWFYFFLLACHVRMYCKSRWLRSWLAMIKRDYLYNPSSIWSVSSGVVVILILTIIQTFYSVLSYYK